jgi:hypothetical protein
VREEERGLGATGTQVGSGKMVAAADEAGFCGIGVVTREVGVNKSGALCSLFILATMGEQ